MKKLREKNNNGISKDKKQNTKKAKEKSREKNSKSERKVLKRKFVFRKEDNIINKKNKRKEKRKTYAYDALEKAVQTVKGGKSIRKAANMHGVPATSLFRAVKCPEKINSSSGPRTILSQKEEKEVVHWILYRAERGFPVTKTELLDSVQFYLSSLQGQTPFTNGRPGRHWYEGFTSDIQISALGLHNI